MADVDVEGGVVGGVVVSGRPERRVDPVQPGRAHCKAPGGVRVSGAASRKDEVPWPDSIPHEHPKRSIPRSASRCMARSI